MMEITSKIDDMLLVLINQLPEKGSFVPAAERDEWLGKFAIILEMVYPATPVKKRARKPKPAHKAGLE